ncbi:hypothetical protein MAM1_1283d11549 [Mucor ambiguus]|uniref:Uncharacterized protein n=1 Tax=Mucor ambiguus TaxID=91626 RepID=A0A0C9MMB7_9FUNG|nr:hypothetical protein MAM1_1283d11549 [Mucor ambiguus]
MSETSLRKNVIEQFKERVDNNVEDARVVIETLNAVNTISEIDERHKSIRVVDTEELKQLLQNAIKEDPDYKKLEELDHYRYLLPRDHHKKKQNKDGDVALLHEFIQNKSEVEFRRNIRMGRRGFLALYEEIKDDEVFMMKLAFSEDPWC